MIQDQKPSLSTCAFGVGAVHVLVLAAILPVMITLPSPDDPASGTVAVPVAVRTALPAPFVSTAMSDPGAFSEVLLYGEGDVDEVVLPAAVPIAARGPDLPAQSALSEVVPLIKQAALSGAVEAEAAVTIAPVIAPVMAPDVTYPENIEVNILARLPDFMPDTVPRPLSKPELSAVRKAPAVKRAPPAKKKARRKPAPPSPRVTKARPKASPKPGFGGFFGGGAARTMKEFPLPASR